MLIYFLQLKHVQKINMMEFYMYIKIYLLQRSAW